MMNSYVMILKLKEYLKVYLIMDLTIQYTLVSGYNYHTVWLAQVNATLLMITGYGSVIIFHRCLGP